MSKPFYDELEVRDPGERDAAVAVALRQQLAHAVMHSPAMAERLGNSPWAEVASVADLARLPVTRKYELLAQQQATRGHMAFGGFAAVSYGPLMRRVFASPGPIYEPEGSHADYWRMGRALYAAGFRSGDLIHNSFSYHLTPAGSMMETGAHAIGCTVFPGGVGNTEQQLAAMLDLQPQGYVGTPSFLKILLEKATEANVQLSIRKAMVSGEACPPSLVAWFAERGVTVYQCYATADVGLIAYETEARQGLVVDEGVVVEIVRPGTNDPVTEGEVGEVVVTPLNPTYPLVRFGTGDLSAVLAGPCPTGRTHMRIKGWMGRADQTTKIRGMFVHPGQIAEVIKRFEGLGKARLVVTGELANDRMTLSVESAADAATLAQRKPELEQALRDVTKLRGEVVWAAPGSLPNDGKVIEDARTYE